jgi:hypothetical protein
MSVSARSCRGTAPGGGWRFRFAVGGRIIGAISFVSTREDRLWPEETVSRLHLVAQMFSNVLARK